jgi:hypothetical protein
MAEPFEDRLWADLVRDHGSQLAAMPRRATTRRIARPWLLGGSAIGIAGAATVLALALAATSPAPAYAVTRNSDGTVTVTIRELIGVAGANAELARMGVRARVVPLVPGCAAVSVPSPDGPKQLRRPPSQSRGPVIPEGFSAVTIRPGAIPAGDTLLIAAREIDTHVQVTIKIAQNPAPTC